jgi:hypothetical protein
MNLPNYFLADLPREASLSPTIVTEACHTLKRNRAQFLVPRSTGSMVLLLTRVAKDWLDPESPFRKLALEQGPEQTGFSPATLASGLDAFFAELTRENFEALLEQDLGDARRLDEMTPSGKARAEAVATAPELIVHIASGNLPNPTLMSMMLGLLARSAQFVKCSGGTSFLPRLFAHSIYEVEPKLGACLEIADWSGSPTSAPVRLANEVSDELLKAAFKEADCVTVTGGDETVAKFRRQAPAKARFLGYGHRVSFGYVASGALAGTNARKVVEGAAADVVAWDQLGCLSPHVIYVESGGGFPPARFAELLAQELQRREQEQPRGELAVEVAAGIASRRSFYEIRAAHSDDTRMWKSENSTAWTVVFETDPRFQLSCLHRFVYVKSVKDLEEALRNADGVRASVSTVGLAAPENQEQALATELARWGVARVCPLGRMQRPPLTWRHDGRPALGDLVRWTDWEM